MKKAILVLVGASCISGAAIAYAAGNAKAGASLSITCVGCHGAGGNSTNPMWPKLASQHEDYIAKQLADFKAGRRKDPMMSGMVATLTPKQMSDLGAYFASQKMTTVRATKPALAKKGEQLYRGGNTKTGVAACVACHGPTGKGVPPAYPAVSGQAMAYTKKQLLAFKNGSRKNDGGIMQAVATRMTTAEINAVAAYMEGLKAK